PDCDEHRRDARDVDDEAPAHPRVAPGTEAVEQGDRPARVRSPVDGAPRAVSDPFAEQARDDEREQEIERDRAEAQPDRPVAADERDERVDDVYGGEAV